MEKNKNHLDEEDTMQEQEKTKAGDVQATSSIRTYIVKEYMHGKMQSDLAEFREGSKIKTGYDNLDEITSMYPGLYVLGAISSLGKTTFVHQMCDQLAESGEEVIYFSLEQSVFDLASKSLARIMAKKDPDTALTAAQIRSDGENQKIAEAIATYDTWGDIEGTFRLSINDIEEYVRNFIRQKGKKPIVVVDYLQALADNEKTFSTKDLVDSNVRRLKQLQSDNKLVIIVISSLNRQNYLSQIDFESFKESGGIEYTADVVWGLQLNVIHDEIFNRNTNINEKRQKIKEAKREMPRKIELCCLKNRFGISSYSCMFDYFSKYDYFVPNYNGVDISNAMADKEGFISILHNFDGVPFE